MERMEKKTSTYCPRAGQYVNFCEDWGCSNIISGVCRGYLDTNRTQSIKQIEHKRDNFGMSPIRYAYEDAKMFARRVA